MDQNVGNKKKREFPSGLVIICILILMAAAITYIIPGGSYERVKDVATGRMIVDPNSFKAVAANHAGLLDIFKAVPKGFLATGWICFLIIIVGGVFYVVTETGAIQAALQSLLSKAKGKDVYFIPVICFLFSIVPTLMGTLEAYLAFVPLGVVVARSMGLDALVGLAMVVCAGGAGLASGITNPFNIGTAQALVGLPVFSVPWYRLMAFIGFNCSVSFWTMRYALKLRKDPKNSYMYDVELRAKAKNQEVVLPKLTGRLVAVLLVVFATISMVVYTALSGGDFKTGIPAYFLIMLVVIGFIMGYSPNDLFRRFTKGVQNVVGGVLVVGFAKAIAIILDQAKIIDTIIHASVSLLDGASGVMTALIMYLIGHIGNFFIISDAGLAAVLVPILSPIGDLAGITQQTVCAAAIFGGALGNMIMPTSPLTSGSCAMAEVDYSRYLHFVLPIFFTNSVIAAVLVAYAAMINLGPF